MRKKKTLAILNLLLKQYWGADSVMFGIETPDPSDDIELPGKDVCDAIATAISAVADSKWLTVRKKQNKPATLRIEIEVPESCPRCMEHLSREWSFCPECGQPTEWSREPENGNKETENDAQE